MMKVEKVHRGPALNAYSLRKGPLYLIRVANLSGSSIGFPELALRKKASPSSLSSSVNIPFEAILLAEEF